MIFLIKKSIEAKDLHAALKNERKAKVLEVYMEKPDEAHPRPEPDLIGFSVDEEPQASGMEAKRTQDFIRKKFVRALKKL